MQKTEKLYDADAYEVEFKAHVVQCDWEEEKNCYAVVLDRTLFFPEEGGQTPDCGVLGGECVLDVQIQEGVITHYVNKKLLVGTVVEGKIDWENRFNTMQQHSGEHIFSGLIHKRFGYDNVGFHLSNQVVTMDFNGKISERELAEIEEEVNRVIIRNLPVQIMYPTKQELISLSYRSKKEIEGAVRIVTIPDVDVCACCAPHVKTTGEIGLLKVLSMQNYKSGVRISIACGFRALHDFRRKTEVIKEVSNYLSANQDTVKEAVARLKEENQSLKEQLYQEKEQRMLEHLSQIPKEQKDVLLFAQNFDTRIIKNAMNMLLDQHEGICAFFSGDDEQGYRFQIGSKNVDLRKVLQAMKQEFDGKGGGNAVMIQGSILLDKCKIEEFIERFRMNESL